MSARRNPDNTNDITEPVVKTLGQELLEWVLYLTVSVGLALLIVHFLGRFTIVDGNSMQPTLQNRNLVIVESLSLRFHGIENGDIVVMKIPELLGGNRTYAIKRVIAQEGQHVRIVEGTVQVDGIALTEPYTAGVATQAEGSPYQDMQVPPGCVYVLGDNRNPDKSRDSRIFGVISRDRVIGKAFVRLFPFSRMGRIE
jgi:signal peptidase I